MTPQERKVMELALEALENHSGNYKLSKVECVKHEAVVEAIKEALSSPNGEAQPEQEPVALMIYRGELCYKSQEDDQSFGMWCPVTQDLPFQEGTKFYTPPQHSAIARSSSATPRKPLTDEQTIILKGATCPEIDWKARHFVEMNNGERNEWMLEWFMAFKVAIEAAHGIKE